MEEYEDYDQRTWAPLLGWVDITIDTPPFPAHMCALEEWLSGSQLVSQADIAYAGGLLGEDLRSRYGWASAPTDEVLELLRILSQWDKIGQVRDRYFPRKPKRLAASEYLSSTVRLADRGVHTVQAVWRGCKMAGDAIVPWATGPREWLPSWRATFHGFALGANPIEAGVIAKAIDAGWDVPCWWQGGVYDAAKNWITAHSGDPEPFRVETLEGKVRRGVFIDPKYGTRRRAWEIILPDRTNWFWVAGYNLHPDACDEELTAHLHRVAGEASSTKRGDYGGWYNPASFVRDVKKTGEA